MHRLLAFALFCALSLPVLAACAPSNSHTVSITATGNGITAVIDLTVSTGSSVNGKVHVHLSGGDWSQLAGHTATISLGGGLPSVGVALNSDGSLEGWGEASITIPDVLPSSFGVTITDDQTGAVLGNYQLTKTQP